MKNIKVKFDDNFYEDIKPKRKRMVESYDDDFNKKSFSNYKKSNSTEKVNESVKSVYKLEKKLTESNGKDYNKMFHDFLDMIEFELVKVDDDFKDRLKRSLGKDYDEESIGKYALYDLQGANLGDINDDTFNSASEMFERLDTYIEDYFLRAIDEIAEENDLDLPDGLYSAEDFADWYNQHKDEPKVKEVFGDSDWDFQVLDMIAHHADEIDLDEVYRKSYGESLQESNEDSKKRIKYPNMKESVKIKESHYTDDWSDTLETGGEPTYCPDCGVKFTRGDDGDSVCPKCHKTPNQIAMEKRRKNESIKGKDDLETFFKMAKQIGIKTFGELQDFLEREKEPGDKDEWETMLRYRASLGNDFKIDPKKNESVNRKIVESDNSEDLKNLFNEFANNTNYLTKKDGYYSYEMYADYRDYLSEESVVEILDSKEPMDKFYEIINESYDEVYFESLDYITDDFIDFLHEKGVDDFDEDDVRETVQDTVSIEPDYDHYLKEKYNCRLIVDSGDANYDFSLNPSYANDYGRTNEENGEKLEEQASIVWLAKTQGYTLEDVQKALDAENSDGLGKFLKSVREEAFNTSSSMNALVFLCRVSLEDLILQHQKNLPVTITSVRSCGLFDTWSGGGSVLDIQLEKPVTIPADMIHVFVPDVKYNGYSVDDVYGLSSSAYDADIKIG